MQLLFVKNIIGKLFYHTFHKTGQLVIGILCNIWCTDFYESINIWVFWVLCTKFLDVVILCAVRNIIHIGCLPNCALEACIINGRVCNWRAENGFIRNRSPLAAACTLPSQSCYLLRVCWSMQWLWIFCSFYVIVNKSLFLVDFLTLQIVDRTN